MYQLVRNGLTVVSILLGLVIRGKRLAECRRRSRVLGTRLST